MKYILNKIMLTNYILKKNNNLLCNIYNANKQKKCLITYKQLYIINYWKYKINIKNNFIVTNKHVLNKINFIKKIIYFTKNSYISYNYIYIKSSNLIKYYIIVFKYFPIINFKIFIYLNLFTKFLLISNLLLNIKKNNSNIKLLKY